MKKLEKNEEVKVVILGAGLSGLWAAQTLRESGFRGDITILEASNSCGGRLRPHGTEKDLPMGAQWFHGREGNCIYEFHTRVPKRQSRTQQHRSRASANGSKNGHIGESEMDNVEVAALRVVDVDSAPWPLWPSSSSEEESDEDQQTHLPNRSRRRALRYFEDGRTQLQSNFKALNVVDIMS